MCFNLKSIGSPVVHVHVDMLAGHIIVNMLAGDSFEEMSSGIWSGVNDGPVITKAFVVMSRMRSGVGDGSGVTRACGEEVRYSEISEPALTGCPLTVSPGLKALLDNFTRSDDMCGSGVSEGGSLSVGL